MEPLGPLLFALTLQPVLERVDAVREEAPLVLYLVDMSIVGKLTPAAGTFRRLCVDDDGVRSIGLEPRLPKCDIYGGDKEQVVAEAAKLRIAHQLDGFTAVGTPLGSAEYVSNAMRRLAATMEKLVDTLVQLPLSVQSQFLLLRASLQARMVHRMRTVPRWRRTCVARTLQCGGRRRPCSTCLQGWVSTVPTSRARTRRAARWVGR